MHLITDDDETLFGAFTLLRERPHVIVVLKSFIQESRPASSHVTAAVREAETAAATEILGCTWEQWDFRDDAPDWLEVASRMQWLKSCGVEHVWAPAFVENGHEQHTLVGSTARKIWPDSITYYTTYSRTANAKQTGTLAPYDLEMIAAKHRALACYKSQLEQPMMHAHFMRDIYEYTEDR